MLLTGPAGSEKSEVLKVARKFLFEFCFALGVLWNDWTIFMTACTGTAAMAMGGHTIAKSACVMKNKPSDEARAIFKGVQILVIDEASFMKDKELLLLQDRLQAMGDRNKPFGGFSIVFSGNFCQLPPIMAKEKDLLWSENSNGLWNNSINEVIILDNEH